MLAVAEVRRWKSLESSAAVLFLKSRAVAYRSEKFPVGMQKWLEKEMYKQTVAGANTLPRIDPAAEQNRLAELEKKLIEEGKARRAAAKAVNV
jgi:hypothetical protein